ncbi:IS3 family transposase [Streptosporangium sp. NPDC023963]|uniref:IS3 family transposase n=1 Tax=Streptosporangium sp. NPDC023963 TaxID=3155608 RepID=UPI0034486E18
MPSPHPPEFRRRAIELARQGDKPLLRLAKDLGISRSCLQNWLKQDEADTKSRNGSRLASETKKRIAELDRRNKQLQKENDILQRAARLVLGKGSAGAIYALVHELADDDIPVARACRVLRVSTSGYYDWLKRPESPRELRNRQLTQMIRRIHADSRGSYGSPRIYAHLRLQLGEKVNHKRVERLTREAGLQVVHHRKPVDQDSGDSVVQRRTATEAPARDGKV